VRLFMANKRKDILGKIDRYPQAGTLINCLVAMIVLEKVG